MKGLFTLDDLTRSIIKEYKLRCIDETDYANYKQRVYRALQKCGLLNAGVKQINPKTKRSCMYYTAQQRQCILAEKTMYDYVRVNSNANELKNGPRYKEVQNDIAARRSSYIEYLSALDNNDDINSNDPVITQKEFRESKQQIILEALFDIFYTPIDDDLLKHDLEKVFIFDDPLNEDMEYVDSKRRLEHPEGNYYSRKS